MSLIYAFLVGGLICAVAQVLMDKAKLLPLHIVVLFVTLGAILEVFGLYDMLVDFAGAGALLPISSFGHSLTHASLMEVKEAGMIGLLSGMFSLTSSGIVITIVVSFFIALALKPKG